MASMEVCEVPCFVLCEVYHVVRCFLVSKAFLRKKPEYPRGFRLTFEGLPTDLIENKDLFRPHGVESG